MSEEMQGCMSNPYHAGCVVVLLSMRRFLSGSGISWRYHLKKCGIEFQVWSMRFQYCTEYEAWQHVGQENRLFEPWVMSATPADMYDQERLTNYHQIICPGSCHDREQDHLWKNGSSCSMDILHLTAVYTASCTNDVTPCTCTEYQEV